MTLDLSWETWVRLKRAAGFRLAGRWLSSGELVNLLASIDGGSDMNVTRRMAAAAPARHWRVGRRGSAGPVPLQDRLPALPGKAWRTSGRRPGRQGTRPLRHVDGRDHCSRVRAPQRREGPPAQRDHRAPEVSMDVGQRRPPGRGRRLGLECKNVDGMAYRFGEWGEPGTDEVPEEYLLQCQHYMTVLDYPEWHLAACVGGNKLKTYIILRDTELEEMLIEQEHAFWQRVQSGERPDPDWQHDTTNDLLRRLHHTVGEGKVDLAELEHWHKVRQDAKRSPEDLRCRCFRSRQPHPRFHGRRSYRDAARRHLLPAQGNQEEGLLR
ncbi:YqaJ viral recombinase family protein [Cupriavidus basilensis]